MDSAGGNHALQSDVVLYTETAEKMSNSNGVQGEAAISGARLDHVAFGVRSMKDAAQYIVGVLGGMPSEGGPGPGYTGAQWSFAGGARIELIEPAGSDGFLHRFLRDRGPGIHHLTFIVPDLERAAASAARFGYDVVGYNDAHPSWKECFLHPKQALGIVVQMAEKSDGPDASNTWGPEFPFPEVREPAAPVAVVALRLTASSRDRAVRQWRDLLGGALDEQSDGSLIFHWPGSPIRLRVVVDATRSDGPKCLEVASDREEVELGGAHPALGAPFVRSASP